MQTQASDASDSLSRVLSSYQPLPGTFDEAANPKGDLRPGWAPLFECLEELTPQELERRQAQAQRQLELEGVAFNPYDVDGGVSRPWTIDPIPLVISQREWDKLSDGLCQRAQIADLILLDLLGPQTLLHEKVLPPEFLFAHPWYSPAYHSLVQLPKNHLQLYAADLARSPDGEWWVTTDRARNPFGLGYILENRLASTRLLPSAFRKCNVLRLAQFFIALRKSLQQLAPRNHENPRVAIWTKGPQSSSYFEDAFLARYLGYTLVEGEDLAVRNNRLNLKSLGGLLPVEVLYRRIEDHNCDPSELVGQGNRGVSGLLEVIRNGGVAVANSIGSTLIESPMLQAYLPAISKHLLGEELKIPSIATWWCGGKKERNYAIKHIGRMIVRRAFRVDDEAPVVVAELNEKEREQLIARIKQRPEQYVAQEMISRSTTPVWDQGKLKPWYVALRSFLVQNSGEFQLLPGALARVSEDMRVFTHNMTSGEKSQDVWIVSEEPVNQVSLLSKVGRHVELKRSGAELPSRVADNLFWLGRHLERAEQVARLVRTTVGQLTTEESSLEESAGLLELCRSNGQLNCGEDVTDISLLVDDLAQSIFAVDSQQSLRNIVSRCHSVASKVRDRIALDSTRVITELNENCINAKSYQLGSADVLAQLDWMITQLNAASGFFNESMTRTLGWRFLDLGRRLERAQETATILQALFGDYLESCLQVCDCFMTYRDRYMSDIQPEPVLDLLLADATNPRSLVYQTQHIVEHVDALPRDELQAALSSEQRIAVSTHNSMRLADVSELCTADANGGFPTLHRMLTRISDQLPRLADVISDRYLIHVGVQSHFATRRVEQVKS